MKTAENVAVFVNVPLFVNWLNNLNSIETAFGGYFGRICGTPLEIEITKLKNVLLGAYFLLPGILTSTLQYLYLYPNNEFNPKFWLLGQLWFISIQYIFVLQEQLKDLKIVLMLTTLKRLYAKFREAVKQEVAVTLNHFNSIWGLK